MLENRDGGQGLFCLCCFSKDPDPSFPLPHLRWLNLPGCPNRRVDN